MNKQIKKQIRTINSTRIIISGEIKIKIAHRNVRFSILTSLNDIDNYCHLKQSKWQTVNEN